MSLYYLRHDNSICPISSMFSMESLQKEGTVRFYTGLPNFQILKAVFDHVVQSLQVKNPRHSRSLC